MTIQDIINHSKPHRNTFNGARQTRIYDDRIEVSIVGGASGLYGDFLNDFEIAVFDRNTNEFITKFFFPEINDDVVSYMPADELVDFLNDTFSKGFQVQ